MFVKCHISDIGTEYLSPGDLCDVLEALSEVKHKWYYIGLKLRILHHTLDDIKANEGSTSDCLTGMLKRWLSNTSPPPSWSDLIQALSSTLVGEKGIAEKIRKQYCHQAGEDSTGAAAGTIVAAKSCRLCKRHFICVCILPSCKNHVSRAGGGWDGGKEKGREGGKVKTLRGKGRLHLNLFTIFNFCHWLVETMETLERKERVVFEGDQILNLVILISMCNSPADVTTETSLTVQGTVLLQVTPSPHSSVLSSHSTEPANVSHQSDTMTANEAGVTGMIMSKSTPSLTIFTN